MTNVTVHVCTPCRRIAGEYRFTSDGHVEARRLVDGVVEQDWHTLVAQPTSLARLVAMVRVAWGVEAELDVHKQYTGEINAG